MIEKELSHIDLFSGIGGFTLAAEWAGFKTVVFCEKDNFCQKILKMYWPKVPNVKEIRNFDGAKWGRTTLLTGGFPCQPFSVAGQRRGKEDDRYLWPEMFRVINEAKPHWILAENVPGIFRMALDTVLADLEAEGYTTGTFIIPACGLNASHKRNRIWIIAHSSKGRLQRQIPKFRKTEEILSKTSSYDPFDSLGKGLFNERNCKDLRTDDGVPFELDRLKALGNAIVPQIAYEILKNIAWIEKEEI